MFLQQVGMLWGDPSVQMGESGNVPSVGRPWEGLTHLKLLLGTSNNPHSALPDHCSHG